MSGSFLWKLRYYVFDINQQLNDLASQLAFKTDGRTLGFGFEGKTKARPSFKPFIVGLIPPRSAINFIPIELDQQKIVDQTPSPNEGQSVSAGVNIESSSSDLRRLSTDNQVGELKPQRTPIRFQELGESYDRNLRLMGVPEERRNVLVPLLIGQAAAENGAYPGLVSPLNYNLTNIVASSKVGEYIDPYNDPRKKPSEIKTPPIPPKSGKYVLTFNAGYDKDAKKNKFWPSYMMAATNLDDATATHLNQLLARWPGVYDANSPEEYAQALRPDLFPAKSGSSRYGFYSDTPEHYASQIKKNSDVYIKMRGGTVSTQGGINYVTIQGQGVAPGEKPTRKNTSVSIIGSAAVTDEENDDPLKFRRGKGIKVSDKRLEVIQKQVDAINNYIDAVDRTPPLALLISPQEFNRTYEHLNDSTKGRRKNIISIWGEKPIAIKGSGVTAAQYIVNSAGSGGLTSILRVQSTSYLNLMSLVRLYKNNGNIFSDSDANFGDGNSGMPLVPMSIYIYYDGHIYIGSFNDFSVTNTADKPNNLSYSFSFNAVYDIDVVAISETQLSGIES